VRAIKKIAGKISIGVNVVTGSLAGNESFQTVKLIDFKYQQLPYLIGKAVHGFKVGSFRRHAKLFKHLLSEYQFDFEGYKAANPDLAVLGNDIDNYIHHFMRHGFSEGRILTLKANMSQIAQFAARPSPLDRELTNAILASLIASYLNMPNGFCLTNDQIFEFLDLAKHLKRKTYVIIGDSHSHAYSLPFLFRHGYMPLWACCHSGSARGLINPKSIAQYGQTIDCFLGQLDICWPNAPIIFSFGQVDVEFVFYFKTLRDAPTSAFSSKAMRAFIEETVKLYFSFLATMLRKHTAMINVATIFPPCIYDGAFKAGFLNATIASLNSDMSLAKIEAELSSLDYPSLKQRTLVHRDFNNALERECLSRSIGLIYVFDELVTSDGVINEKYVHTAAKGAEHHLRFDTFSELVAGKLDATGL
jgi:hypothetical protein